MREFSPHLTSFENKETIHKKVEDPNNVIALVTNGEKE